MKPKNKSGVALVIFFMTLTACQPSGQAPEVSKEDTISKEPFSLSLKPRVVRATESNIPKNADSIAIWQQQRLDLRILPNKNIGKDIVLHNKIRDAKRKQNVPDRKNPSERPLSH